MKRHHTIEVEYDCDIRDFETEQLAAELLWRKNNAEPICEALKAAGCPREILEPLEDWLHERPKTKQDLEAWKEFCK